jgi:molybdopterin molybdotransferase
MHGMRPFGALLPHDEALARLLEAASPLERVEDAALLDARGRVCAEEVRAPVAVPPFARAVMDGYAVRAEDAAAPGARLRVAGVAHAGRPFGGSIRAGEAVRIATGAPLPEGADAVCRVEDTREEPDGRVALAVAVPRGRAIDGAGSDIAEGSLAVRRGDVLTPARLGLLASLGLARVRVVARPRVALHSSGDELLQPGEAPAPGRIYDANSTSLAALLLDAGAAVERAPPLPDELGALRAALRASAARADVVLLSGGASVGERDLAVDAVRAEGQVLFHGVRVKPGKPLLGGRIGDALVVGLPGNPTSALSNAALFVLPAVRRLARLPPVDGTTRAATLAEAVAADAERFLFLPVRLEGGRAVPTFKGSGALTSLAGSDGWIGVPPGADLPAGARVEVHPWQS